MLKSVYVHIPFCDEICSYCDFCKMYYQEKWVYEYLKALEKEIITKYNNELIDTIYIGGGTPSCLNSDQLEFLFKILNRFKISSDLEYTIECNIESITSDKLKLFKKYNINRLSFGIQSFNSKTLKLLNRKTDYIKTKKVIYEAKKIGFGNINVDIIYAVPNQSLQDLKEDIDKVISLDIEHISTYSLIIEENTKLSIDKYQNIDEELDFKMYEYIQDKLKENGYEHYEISNFSKVGYKCKHNLTYWNNLEYYGFGLGASGFVNKIRYTNTRNIKKYISGKYELDSEKMTKKECMENEMILGLRKIKGVNKKEFEKKYQLKMKDLFPIEKLVKEKNLKIKGNYISIPKEYLYVSNDILIQFLLD